MALPARLLHCIDLPLDTEIDEKLSRLCHGKVAYGLGVAADYTNAIMWVVIAWPWKLLTGRISPINFKSLLCTLTVPILHNSPCDNFIIGVP